MKKFIMAAIVLTAAVLTFSASAQMRVAPSGQIRIGYNVDDSDKSFSAKTQYDENASLVLIGKTLGTSLGGYLSFGPGSDVLIGESPLFPNALMIDATNGIVFRKDHKVAFSYGNLKSALGVESCPEFRFYCDVMAPSFLVSSDARLKKDIAPLESQGASLLSLTPVRYRFNSNSTSLAAEGMDTVANMEKVLMDDKERYGFIAQEVRDVYPELVTEGEDGMLSVDYIGFIPLLVDEIKALKSELSECMEEIQNLRDQNGMKKINSVEMIGDESMVLGQNRPNPFSMTTEIECTIPESVSDAAILVFDMQGKQLQKINVEGRGETSVTISGSSLSNGMYIYSLVADGIEVSSRRMILTD